MHPPLPPPWHRLRHATLRRWPPRFSRNCLPSLVLRRIATTDATNPAATDLPKLALTPGSRHHNSLASFLDYFKRAGLPTNRTTYVGTHYEYATAIAFQRFGMSLTRVGRRHDDGIDLIGHWVMTPLREPMPVIVQCKSRTLSLGPCHIRELEGAFDGVPAEWRNKHVLGILATSAQATKGTLEAMSRSRRPMAFAMVSRKGTVQQFVWNRAASEHGLEGVGVTARYTPLPPDLRPAWRSDRGPSNPVSPRKSIRRITEVIKDVQLTWMGSPIFPERQVPPLDLVDLSSFEALKIAPDPPAQFLVPEPCGGQFEHTPGDGADVEPKIEMRGRPRAAKNSRALCIKARAWKMVYSEWEVPKSQSPVEAVEAIIDEEPEVKQTQDNVKTTKTIVKQPVSRAKVVKAIVDDKPGAEEPASKTEAVKATAKQTMSGSKAVNTTVGASEPAAKRGSKPVETTAIYTKLEFKQLLDKARAIRRAVTKAVKPVKGEVLAVTRSTKRALAAFTKTAAVHSRREFERLKHEVEGVETAVKQLKGEVLAVTRSTKRALAASTKTAAVRGRRELKRLKHEVGDVETAVQQLKREVLVVTTCTKRALAAPKPVVKKPVRLEIGRLWRRTTAIVTAIKELEEMLGDAVTHIRKTYRLTKPSEYIHGRLKGLQRPPPLFLHQRILEANERLFLSMTSAAKRRATMKKIAAEKVEEGADKG